MRKGIAVLLSVGALAIPATAVADPDFGPGNSSKGPHEGKCHTAGHGTGPGANEPVPGCKGTKF
jgi:hypothetical protein